MITLIDGRTWNEADIDFDPVRYHFHSVATQEDLTDDIYRKDKLALVPDFNVDKENLRISAERGSGGKYGADPLSTSTTGIFVNQILTDPLSAPIESLNNTVAEITASTGVKTLVIGGIVLVIAILALRK